MPKITLFGGAVPPVTDEEKAARAQEAAVGDDSSILDTPVAEAPARPAVNDLKAAWVEYAVWSGWDRDEAEAATKQSLIKMLGS